MRLSCTKSRNYNDCNAFQTLLKKIHLKKNRQYKLILRLQQEGMALYSCPYILM